MKKQLLLIVFLINSINLFSQAPQRMSYQAVIRNSSNALVTSKEIGMRVSILQGTTTGQEVYKEIYNPNPQTNANGLVSIEIGGGIPITGTFPGINWANGPYFIKTETDPTGGTNYTISGTSQLLSVPYALYAGNVVNSGGKPILFIQGDLTNEQVQAKITAELGPNTQQIIIQSCTALTSIDLSSLTNAVSVQFYDNENLQSINLSKLETLGSLDISNCPKLNTLNLSSLKQLSNLNLGKTGLTNFTLTSLNVAVKLNCGIYSNPLLASFSITTISKSSYISFSSNNILSSVSFPALQVAESISFYDNSSLTTFNFPALKSLLGFGDGDGGLSVQVSGTSTLNFQQLQTANRINIQYTSLTSVSFPALTTAGNIQISGNTNLASIQLPVLANRLIDNSNNSYIGYNFYSNKLASSQINTLLNRLVNLTPTFSGAYINLSNQTPPAPPTGQGLIDKATLQSRGNQVQTD